MKYFFGAEYGETRPNTVFMWKVNVKEGIKFIFSIKFKAANLIKRIKFSLFGFEY